MSLQGFNLLKKQTPPATAWEKVYAWVLGTARIIVIIVEVLVVGSFALRIVLDTHGKNIEKDVESRSRVLAGFEQSEARFRSIQSKTADYQKFWTASSNYTQAMQEVEKFLTANFNSVRFDIDEDVMTIKGEGDISKISELEKAIKGSSTFKNVEVFDINTEETGARRGTFGIRAVLVNPYTRTM